MQDDGKAPPAAETTTAPPGNGGAKEEKAGVKLGEPELFAKLGPDGKLLAVRGVITLKEKLGQLYSVQGKLSISAAGYAALNQVAGVNVITPLTLRPGESNPNLITDDLHRLRAVEVRKIAFGLSPTGNVVVSDSLVRFDLWSYRLHEMANLIKNTPSAGTFLHQDEIAAHEAKLSKDRSTPEKPVVVKGWFLLYEAPLGIWLDLSHADVKDKLVAAIQRQKFAERIATTIAWRNCMKQHPAIARAIVETVRGDAERKNREAVVTVFGFRHDFSQTQMERLSTLIADGKMDDAKEGMRALSKGGEVETVEAATVIDPEKADDTGVVAATIAEEADEAAGEVRLAQAQELPLDEANTRRDLIHEVSLGVGALGDHKRYSALLKELHIENVSLAPLDKLRELNAAISKEVSEREIDKSKPAGIQGAKPKP